jgi:general secretion pathway protein E
MKPKIVSTEPGKEPAAAALRSVQRDLAAAGARPVGSARDAALGRESDMERSISPGRTSSNFAQTDLTLNVISSGKLTWRTLLAWLRDDKILSAEDIERTARRFAGGNSAQHPLVRLGGAGLARLGDGKLLDTETLTEWLARRFKMPYVRIDPLKVDVGRVADVMSIQYAERRHALPLSFGLTEVTIATCEPLDVLWVPEIEAHTRRTIKLVLVNPTEIARYTTEFYALSRSVRNATKMGESAALANFEQLVELGKSGKQLDANDSGVIQVVDWLWQYAFDQRASDIHLEPRRERSVIRFRIDGVMHTVYQLPPGVMSAMVARVKLLGRMDVIERRRPLDGRIKVRNPAGDEVEMRLSTLPTAFGEKMVMRIFDPDTTVKTLENLGFGSHDGRRWEELVARPHGIILVTGPTGSGKTTTLYSTLRRLATDEVNVCTIEDPIEMIQPAFNQTQVQNGIDLGFTEGLRALMRQDPDIIMVGEIRDLPTADMAIQASLTGHLVFSTLHTNDSASAITRLNDLGVAPYLIGSTLIGVLAQRLVRTLCVACKQPDEEVTRETLHEVVKPWRLNGGVRPYKAVGCLECRMTGFRGRAGLFELLTVSDAARSAIQPVCDESKLRHQALQDGLRPLRLAGAMKVAEGVTTLDEVLRATPAWE